MTPSVALTTHIVIRWRADDTTNECSAACGHKRQGPVVDSTYSTPFRLSSSRINTRKTVFWLNVLLPFLVQRLLYFLEMKRLDLFTIIIYFQ